MGAHRAKWLAAGAAAALMSGGSAAADEAAQRSAGVEVPGVEVMGQRQRYAAEETVSATRTDTHHEFAVSDKGIGIEEQYAERVFVIFQRLHPKDTYEGTGIGLSLCKKIVEHHGGRIWIEPVTEGRGTSVRWTLPAVTTDDEPATADHGGADLTAGTTAETTAGTTAETTAVGR